MADSDALVALAVIGAPHAVHGTVRVRLYNPESELLFELDKVWLRGPAGTEARAIEHIHVHGPSLLLVFEGVKSREGAEALRGLELCVPRTALPALPQGEHYFIDLIGLAAVDAELRRLGRVTDVQQYPASEVLCVELDGGERYEVPMREPYLRAVELEAGRVVLDRLDELEPVPVRPARKRRKR